MEEMGSKRVDRKQAGQRRGPVCHTEPTQHVGPAGQKRGGPESSGRALEHTFDCVSSQGDVLLAMTRPGLRQT